MRINHIAKTILCGIFLLLNCVALFAQNSNVPQKELQFAMLNGNATLGIEKWDNSFTLRFTDNNIKKQYTGNFDVRKKGDAYIIDYKRYYELETGLEDSLKNYFRMVSLEFYVIGFYKDKDILWNAFSNEVGFPAFMNIFHDFFP